MANEQMFGMGGFGTFQDVEKKRGFFTKKQEEKGPSIADILEQTMSLSRRVKVLEERQTEAIRRIEIGDNNLVIERQRVTKELRAIDSEIMELKKSINEINSKLDLIVAELKGCASKDEFNALKKYIDMWDPISFVRREEVEKIIDEKINKEE